MRSQRNEKPGTAPYRADQKGAKYSAKIVFPPPRRRCVATGAEDGGYMAIWKYEDRSGGFLWHQARHVCSSLRRTGLLCLRMRVRYKCALVGPRKA